MKSRRLSLYAAIVGTAVGLTAISAQAASLQLVPGIPDITTSNSDVSYTYSAGTGGNLTITGSLPGNTVGQTIRLVSGGPIYYVIPNYPDPTYNLETGYQLHAAFDTSGHFVSGTVAVTGLVASNPANPNSSPLPGYSSGTLLTANLTKFGFTGISGSHDTLTLDFLMTLTGGDLHAAGFSQGGLIWSGGVSPSFGGNWDPLNNNSGLAFQRNFATCAGCTATLDTFVPLPASVWLFLSGLLVLGTCLRRSAGRI